MPSSSPYVLGQCFLCILSHIDLCLDLAEYVSVIGTKKEIQQEEREADRKKVCVCHYVYIRAFTVYL